MSNSLKRRDAAQAYQSWYWSKRWRQLRRDQLRKEPWCAECLKQGKRIVATVCDHIYPHKGDTVKFWSGPFASLCKPHHDIAKQREESIGFSGEVGSDGWPVDPNHPANKAGK